MRVEKTKHYMTTKEHSVLGKKNNYNIQSVNNKDTMHTKSSKNTQNTKNSGPWSIYPDKRIGEFTTKELDELTDSVHELGDIFSLILRMITNY